VTSVADAIGLLNFWYEPDWAEVWDSVGLISGSVDVDLRTIHLAIDPTIDVAREAIALDAQLLVVHHPLWLGGTDRIDGAKGHVIAQLHNAGCALFVAHTNADVAYPGVSDALAAALGLVHVRVMSSQNESLDRWVVHVPPEFVEVLLNAVAQAGAGTLGSYERCAFISEGTGTFRPLPGATPYAGEIGSIERIAEARLEFVGKPKDRAEIARALRDAHPYEEPSFTVTPTSTPANRGLGRVGELSSPMRLAEFVAHVARSLPATAGGIRATGDADARVRTVAVAGGSCLELDGAAAAAGADVFVTSDAKHHRAQEARLPIVDVPHWAGEWPWSQALGDRLQGELDGVEVHVSRLVTDPWTMAAGDRVDSGL
jgi:dinuclear metal center YbgI/SA1388 family protein